MRPDIMNQALLPTQPLHSNGQYQDRVVLRLGRTLSRTLGVAGQINVLRCHQTIMCLPRYISVLGDQADLRRLS
jgi:hypothetical protein